MNTLLPVVFLLLVIQDVPLKPKEDYEVKLQYELRKRPVVDFNDTKFNETVAEHEKRTSGALLPHVGIDLKLINLTDEETRIKIQGNLGGPLGNKKVKKGDVINFVMGFTDDMKDRTGSHEFIVRFLDGDRKEVSRIVFVVQKDGTFLVNDEKRGKF